MGVNHDKIVFFLALHFDKRVFKIAFLTNAQDLNVRFCLFSSILGRFP